MYIEANNANPRSSTWTKSADAILVCLGTMGGIKLTLLPYLLYYFACLTIFIGDDIYVD